MMMAHRTRPFLFALFLGLMLHSVPPAWAGDPPAAQQTPVASPSGRAPQATGLTVVIEDGVQQNGPNGAFRDFGTVDSLTTKRQEQTFHLRNSGATPIDINYIQPSCGCASVVLSADNDRNAYTIAPGAQVAVRMTLDLNRVQSGHIAKFAMVYVKGSNAPAFTLEMRGEMPPVISYSSRVLDFGRLDAGVGRTLTLMITVDKRLLAVNPPPRLICTNPDIQITPQPDSTLPPKPLDDKTITHSYAVTLARNARIGVVGGAIAFVPGDSRAAAPPPTQYGIPGIIPDALDGASAIISGQVVGKFYASPYLLVMGSIPQGKEIIRQIQLVGQNPEILQDLTLTCSLPTMSARVLPKAAATQPGTALNEGTTRFIELIEVKLDAQTPAGGLNGEIVITAKDGERFIVTLLGDVVKIPGSPPSSAANSQ